MPAYDTIIIGGGPAGMLAAIGAGRSGKRVLLMDKNARLGRKLLITGKGRCNITNDCEPAQVMKNIPRNSKFLYSALSRFSPADTMELFTSLNVPLKTERGRRVFPESDKAVDVVDALVRATKDAGVHIITASASQLLITDGQISGVRAGNEEFHASKVLIATGGCSYPGTGSTGDGYTLASQAGHTIVAPTPSLVPIVTQERWCADAMGLSLRNVTLCVQDNKMQKQIYKEQGEMLFTHFGVSGPLVLSASAHMHPMVQGRYRLEIDLKPALDMQKLDARMQRELKQQANRDFSNLLGALVPQKLIPIIIQLSDIAADTKGHSVTREERTRLCALLKCLPLTAKSFRPIEEAIVTSGGVSVSEVNPKTMESRLLPGLFFAGEVLDVDGYTGGFNLQIAFSTGFAAGLSI